MLYISVIICFSFAFSVATKIYRNSLSQSSFIREYSQFQDSVNKDISLSDLTDEKKRCEILIVGLSAIDNNLSKIKCGKSLVFFNQEESDALKKLEHFMATSAAIQIQSIFRMINTKRKIKVSMIFCRNVFTKILYYV